MTKKILRWLKEKLSRCRSHAQFFVLFKNVSYSKVRWLTNTNTKQRPTLDNSRQLRCYCFNNNPCFVCNMVFFWGMLILISKLKYFMNPSHFFTSFNNCNCHNTHPFFITCTFNILNFICFGKKFYKKITKVSTFVIFFEFLFLEFDML